MYQQNNSRKFSRDDRKYTDEYRPNNNFSNDGGRQRKRSASRSRSRSRSDSRDRKRRDRGYDNDRGGRGNDRFGQNRDQSFGNYSKPQAEPSAVIVIKGLPSHTNEPTLHAVLGPYYPKDIRLITQRDGECKGYAFVEFIALEYAQYFMSAFAGSAGDPDAPQLIIENRGVTIEYAREQTDKRKEGFSNSRMDERKIRTDWLCDACSCHNFARRDTCFKCSLPRSERAVALPQGSEPFGDSVVGCDTPGLSLVVRGFGQYVTEEQIMELFRQYAVVKNATIIRDAHNGVSKGFAFVEFHSIDHASYALQCSKDLKFDNNMLKVAFAREKVMQQMISQMQSAASMPMHSRPTMHLSGMANSLVASAMQAAQWSMNNGYGSGTVPMAIPTVSQAGVAPSASGIPTLGVQKPKMIWPPNFESFGGGYLFQPKSGYFLEPMTEFFYCPKSKLYYSAKDGVYYQYDASIDPPYKKFVPPLPTEADDKPSDSTQGMGAIDTGKAKPITLSLGVAKGKTKPIGTAKKVLKDLAKWEAIQKDDAEDEEAEMQKPSEEHHKSQSVFVKSRDVPKTAAPVVVVATPKIHTVPSEQSPSAPPTTTAAASSSQPTTTVGGSSGAAVCNLCRRQFPSAEMLARHEKESKLHAENLVKQQKEKEKAAAVPQYRDRAEERRQLFGSVADHVEKPQYDEVQLHTISEMMTMPVLPPTSVKEDVANPGNQMLRKMGWKEGQGLGKDADGHEEALGVTLAGAQSSSMHATLKSTASDGSSAHGSHYRDNLLAATRARYEQISKQQQ